LTLTRDIMTHAGHGSWSFTMLPLSAGSSRDGDDERCGRKRNFVMVLAVAEADGAVVLEADESAVEATVVGKWFEVDWLGAARTEIL